MLSDFDLDKAMKDGGKCRTNGGALMRIVFVKKNGCLIALDDKEGTHDYDAKGLYCPHRGDSYYDLENLPEEHVRYIGLDVSKGADICLLFESRYEALMWQERNCTNLAALKKVTIPEGQFDE